MYYIWHIYTYFFGFHYTYVHLSLSLYMYIFIYVYKCIFTYIYMFPTDPPNLRMTPPFIFIACVGIPTSFFSDVPWPRPPSCLIAWWVEVALHTWVSTILDFHVCFLFGKLTWLENHSFSIGECHRLHFFWIFQISFCLFTRSFDWGENHGFFWVILCHRMPLQSQAFPKGNSSSDSRVSGFYVNFRGCRDMLLSWCDYKLFLVHL